MTIQNNTNIACNRVLPNLFGFTILSQSSRKITRFVLLAPKKQEERKIFVCICLHCYQINATTHCQQNISIITYVVAVSYVRIGPSVVRFSHVEWGPYQ